MYGLLEMAKYSLHIAFFERPKRWHGDFKHGCGNFERMDGIGFDCLIMACLFFTIQVHRDLFDKPKLPSPGSQ